MNKKANLRFFPSIAPRNYTKYLALAAVLAVGFLFRFYRILNDNFFLFDEGFYLNYNMKALRLIEFHFANSLGDFWTAVLLHIRAALVTGKALWFLIVDARVFWGALEDWRFPHVVSAVFGSLTLLVIFAFAKKLFNSFWIAILSVLILAVLPSHVFYSRLAIQEGMCGFFFILGFYFYLFPKEFGRRTFLSAFFLAMAYFSNYRLLVIPALVFFVELYAGVTRASKINIRKYTWHTLTFLFLVFGIGALNNGENTILTFAWVFHQAPMATQHFDIVNFLSYPYYLFRLESFLFAAVFFGNVYFLFKKNWERLFPFTFSLFYMGIFSLTAEKGARYLCAMLPFIVISVASLLVELFRKREKISVKLSIVLLTAALILSLALKSLSVVHFSSDYKSSIEYLKTIDPKPKVATTQPWIAKLYLNKNDVTEAPRRYDYFVRAYNKGFRYLIVCPQAYVSWTGSRQKFDFQLADYLYFITANLKPLKEFPHFNHDLLERFAFEHSENLRQTVAFINSPNPSLGKLRVYDIKNCITVMERYARKDARLKEGDALANSPVK